VSQSPIESGGADEETEPDAAAAYARGWAALNRLMRRGRSWSGNEPHAAFLNVGDGTFADASFISGFGLWDDGRALATLDWDRDGDLDLLLSARNGPRIRMMRNHLVSARDRSSVSLLLRGTTCNRDAVGARVELHLGEGDAPLVRAVRAGEGYLAQSSSWITVGLGGTDVELARVVVHWPGGAAETFAGVEPGGAFVLTQGTGRATAHAPAPRDDQRPTAVSARPAAKPAGDRIVLASPVPLPRLAVRPAGGEELALFGVRPGGGGTGTGRPVLLHLWGSWCAPCLAELGTHAPRLAELGEAGLAFLALSADEDESEATRVMTELGWPDAWALAPPETVAVLDALYGTLLDTEQPLPIPTSFLVDAEGALRALYVGPVDPDRLLADLELVELAPEEQLDRAVPFAGTWFRTPATDLALFERSLARRGLSAAANEFSRGGIEVVQRTRAEMLHAFGRERVLQGDLDAAVATFRRAIAEDPELLQAHLDLGIVLQQRGDLFEAISAYLAALELDPDHEDARFNLALAYLGTGQTVSAERERRELEERGSALAEVLADAMARLRAEREDD
jgi:tetratricopeptide (TPR) repeat protein